MEKSSSVCKFRCENRHASSSTKIIRFKLIDNRCRINMPRINFLLCCAISFKNGLTSFSELPQSSHRKFYFWYSLYVFNSNWRHQTASICVAQHINSYQFMVRLKWLLVHLSYMMRLAYKDLSCDILDFSLPTWRI